MNVVIGFLLVVFVIWIVLMIEEIFTRTSKRERDLQRHIDILKEEKRFNTAKTSLDLDSTEPTHFGNMYMSRKEKKAYMKSAQWQTKRKQVFERDNHQCQLCGSTESLNCHHQSYMHLGDEPLEHLITLCIDCHSTLHAQRGYTRKGNYFI